MVRLILNAYVEFFQGYTYDGPGYVYLLWPYAFAWELTLPLLRLLILSYLLIQVPIWQRLSEAVSFSIDPGQTEGAKSIGMTHVQTMIYVILPQALRNLMPQIGNNLIINIKDSCVLSVIGVAELLYKTKAQQAPFI